MLIRTLAVVIPVWAFLLLTEPSRWVQVIAVVSVMATSLDIVWLSFRIRRDERSGTPH